MSLADAWRCRVSDAVTLDGKLFQTRGAATKNARSPIVERLYDGVMRADVDAERSRLLASMSATRHRSFARYGTAVPCRQWNTSTASLNSIRSHSTGNQWRSQSSGIMCSYFRAEQTSRAAALITLCSLSSCFLYRPASMALLFPDMTAPARRPATVVLLAAQTDECCAAGVVQRSSWTQSWSLLQLGSDECGNLNFKIYSFKIRKDSES